MNEGWVTSTRVVRVCPCGSCTITAPLSGSSYWRSGAASPGSASVPAGRGFKSKEQIALAIIQEQHDRIYAGVDQAIADHADPLIRLMAISRMICEQLRTDSVVRAGISLALGQGALREASARSYSIWVKGVAQLLGKLDREGLLNSDIPIEWLSRRARSPEGWQCPPQREISPALDALTLSSPQ